MRAYLSFSSLLALALFGLSSRPAHAQSTCSADTDCVKGWTCQVTGGSSCGAPACAPGEKCASQPSDCVTEEFKSCRPGACTADSDCAEGMVCYTHTESNCPPTACTPGQTCPPSACEPKTESACVPRYVLPCTTASDCGAGFKCESAGEECACSGSAGGSGDPRDGGTPPPSPPETSCICEPSKELRCHADPVKCETNSDCTAGWTCASVGATSDCESAPAPTPTPPGESGAQGGAAPAPVPAPAPDCRPSAELKQCVPPYYSLVGGSKGVDRESAGSPTLETGAGNGSTGSADNAAPPTAPTPQDADTSSAGCSMAHGSGAGSTLLLFGALGMFCALRRRRAS